MCHGGGAAQHLGWRFTRKPGAVGPGPETFVALIVAHRAKEAEAPVAERVRVPLAAVATLREDDELQLVEDADSAAEKLGPLSVGVEAPGWLTAMIAAVTARAAPSSSRLAARG